MGQLLERLFKLKQHGTSARTELLGGATTFVTMAYIIVVNPAILARAEIPLGPSTLATILAAAFGSLLMGLYANRPIAVAPYMGENAFIAFSLSAMTICGDPIHWRERLGAVFVSGAAFFVLTLVGLRAWLAGAVSRSMKASFAVGIGLFLLFIGAYLCRIVVGTGSVTADAPPVKIGNLHDPEVLLAVAGFVLIAVLMMRRVRGSVLIGVAATALAGFALAAAGVEGVRAPEPGNVPEGAYDLGQVALQLDVWTVLHLSFFPILLTLFLISFLDTLGTLVAVGSAGDMLDREGNFPDLHRPMLVDSVSCMFSALVGTSTSGAYIESATGIREGARTGLAAVVVAALFLASAAFIPWLQMLQHLQYAYGPALMAVGVLMVGAVVKIDFADLTEAVPAVAAIALTVFSYNIANGLTAGLVLYPVCKVLGGKARELTAGAVVLALLCLVYLVFGVPH